MGLPIEDQMIQHQFFFVNDPDIIVHDKEHTKCVTKELIDEYQRWSLNVSSLKTEELYVRSGIQNMRIEDNIEIKGTMAFK
jgi:hypothetical protein